MNARNRLTILALVATGLVAIACRGTIGPHASPPAPAEEDAGALVVRAWQANQGGDRDVAMDLLRRADALGLDIPFEARDFPGLSEREEWKAIAARAAAREPKTGHAALETRVPERGLVAEGLAADPNGRSLYVSSIPRRKILRLAPDGTVSDFVPTARGGLLSPLGMKVDAARGLLWVAANASPAMDGFEPSMRGLSGVFAFDRGTGALRRSATISGEGHFLNDVAVAPDGTVFVTDSAAGAVLRLDVSSAELRQVVKGDYVYPNGILVVGRHVVFAHATGLHAFPIAGGSPIPVRGPARFPLGGFDGLAMDGTTVFAIQNGLGKPRVVRMEIDPAVPRVMSATVVETANPEWRVPTTGAFARGGYVYIGNSCVDAVTDAGVGADALVETVLLKLPARAEARPIEDR